jgi:hypothetical protein
MYRVYSAHEMVLECGTYGVALDEAELQWALGALFVRVYRRDGANVWTMVHERAEEDI